MASRRGHGCAFLLALNDYSSDGRTESIAAMTEALDMGAADHVVVDMRYLRGGAAHAGRRRPRERPADQHSGRIDRPHRSRKRIGGNRDRVELDAIAATLVGEMTPARADNFLCGACQDHPLSASGYVLSVPDRRSGNGDTRMAIEPDVAIVLSSVDFLAGKIPRSGPRWPCDQNRRCTDCRRRDINLRRTMRK